MPQKQLDVLQKHIDAMHLQCDEAQSQLHSTNEACRSLLERAGGLRSARQVHSPFTTYVHVLIKPFHFRQTIQDQQLAVDSFLEHFTLTEEEVDALQSRDIQLNVQFFRIMGKAERVINDSRVLMSIEGGPSAVGCVVYSSPVLYLVLNWI